jgi:hypothetical protein
MVLYQVSRRVFLTVPDFIADALERWADKEGTKAATLAGFIVEREVREGLRTGEIPPAPNHETEYDSLKHLVMYNRKQLMDSGKFADERLKELMDGAAPTELETVRLALLLDLTEEYVATLPIKKS